MAFLPDIAPTFQSWINGAKSEMMQDGWTRYNSRHIVDTTIWCTIGYGYAWPWLSQAHHIFCRLQVTSSYEDYVVVGRIEFRLKISAPTHIPPDGYLFVCPEEDLRIGRNSFRWPDCPAYWSLNSRGSERLSLEEATHLGFPFMELHIEARGRFWDASVYAGLRQFHQAKGFDPDSQDVAKALGHPLYQLSRDQEIRFAHTF
ncbi:hypothetical protein C8R44DRAFT_807817 [Mycena epipterygia]|nr:hypothetical protein C8R44DRAFT_807817 [Mycena epipterygia]